MINFQHIPSNLRVPLFYAEVNNSLANTVQLNYRALIIGQITSAGSATPGVPVISSGAGSAISLGGVGSQLALMAAAYYAADPFGEVWYLPLSDNGSGTAATGTITCTSPASANGTLSLYIAGVAVPVVILSSNTNAQNATAIAAAINANTNLPCTATASSAVVTVTAKNAGLCGNDIDMRVNYYGAQNGEVIPSGFAATFSGAQLSGGATNPVLSSALATLSSQSYDFIVSPFTDATNFAALTAYLNDTSGTWSYAEQLYGHAFYAYRGSFSALGTYGTAKNDQHSTVLGFYDSPTPAWVIAADLAGTAATSLRNDPALPLQTLPLSTMLPPPLASRFPLAERNVLLYDGISTYNVNQAGQCILENIITTYQLNGFGQPDNSYLEIETMYTLAYILRVLSSVVTSRYARVKLAADGTKFAAGSAIVTPSIIRSDLIAEYQQLVYNGFAQNAEAFAQNLIVEINASNPNRVDVLFPPTLIDQLRVFAVLAQFRLN